MSLKKLANRSLIWVVLSGSISSSELWMTPPAARILSPFCMQSFAVDRSTSPRTGSEPFFRLKATCVAGAIITEASTS